ncbi:MAG: molybdopterin-synthase adenylyltransferase MoeB [Pseudomonadota bacterium]
MLLVFLLCGVLWGMGHLMGAPHAARMTMIGLLYVAVLGLHVALPNGHPLRMATGESPALWLIIGGFALLIFLYREGLGRLKQRAHATEAHAEGATPVRLFSESELNRYARHMVLREIGGPGQKKLKQARVLVIGAGGLGAPVLQYLAAAGVGTIGVIDDDVVENANLQRQVIHRDASIGMPKVFSAQAEMEAQNPYVTVRPYNRRLDEDIAADLFDEYDLIVDGTDNFDSRYLANRTAVEKGLPLISGALSQWEGQISVFHPAQGAPCYQCVFDSPPARELAPSCAEAGVLGPLPGVVGSMMAAEAVKVLTAAGQPLLGQMLIYDALFGESRTIALKPRPDCPTCGMLQRKSS